jgi:hypothetical protein
LENDWTEIFHGISYAGTPLFVVDGAGILVSSSADVGICDHVVNGNRNSYLLGDTTLRQSRWLHANRTDEECRGVGTDMTGMFSR